MDIIKNIGDFAKSLLPTFNKDRVLEDIRIISGEFNAMKDPLIDSAKFFKDWTYKSPEVKKYNNLFKSNISGKDNGNMIVHIGNNIEAMIANINKLESIANDNLSPTIAGTGLSIKQSVIIRYVDSFSFVSKYISKYLNFVYIFETFAVKDSSDDDSVITDSISPADIKWIDNNFDDFISAYTACIGESEKITQAINDIPDLQAAQSNIAQLEQTIGSKKIDPLNLNRITKRFNPIYFVRMIIAEYQFARYKERKEEIAILALRKLNLENISKKRPNAKVQAQIQVLESRIKTLNEKVSEFEDEVA